MHRSHAQKTLLCRFKSFIRSLRTLTSTVGRKKITARYDNPKHIFAIPSTYTTTVTTAGHACCIVAATTNTNARLQAALCATEVYLPGHLWDSLNPAERFASVADLCAHLGDQLPTQVVKLIARDVLRGLKSFYETHEVAYNNISPTNILLSPTDLRALISQLRADTQPSLRPSEISIGIPFIREGGPNAPSAPDTTAVFSLSNPEDRENHFRPECSDRQGILAPEGLLGAPCGTSADMWALGCVLFELLTGEALFEPTFQTLELGISKEESHLIQMVELFGEMPQDLINAGKFSDQWFTEDGCLRIDTTYYPVTLGSVLERHIEKNDIQGTTAFLETLLELRPENRARPQDIIDHPWFSH